MTAYMKKLDTRPFLQVQLRDGDGDAVDISGATVVLNVGSGGSRISRKSASIVSPDSGVVRYEWEHEDTALPGRFQGEFEVTYSDGKVETFPRDTYFDVIVEDRKEVPSQVLQAFVDAANALLARVADALAQVTNDRFLDLNGDGIVTGLDISIAASMVSNMSDLRNGDATQETNFKEIPAAISDMVGGAATEVPVHQTDSGDWMLTDLNNSLAVDNSDFSLAKAVADSL